MREGASAGPDAPAVIDSRPGIGRLAGMKALLRFYFLLLVSLTLPINGMASLLMPAQACAVHASQYMPSPAMPGMDQQMSALDPCCETMAQTGHKQPCKTGMDCKAGSLLQVGSGKSALLLIDQPGPFPSSFTPLPGASEPLWHPPRS